MSIDIDTTDVDIVNTTHELDASTSRVDVSSSDEVVEARKSEYAIVGDGLFASVTADEAPTWLLSIIDSVLSVRLANSLTSLDGAIADISSAVASIDIANNNYVDNINYRATLEGIVNTRITQLNATVASSIADVTTLALARATPEEVSVLANQQVEASLDSGSIRSVVDSIQLAHSDLQSSSATSFDTLTTQMADPETGLLATANATEELYTYVGIDSQGNTLGDGLLQDVQVLKDQNDGVTVTHTDTHDVILKSDTNSLDDDEMVMTAEPYATWMAEDIASGNTDSRTAHVGDVYIKYVVVNGTREYVNAHKFIRTAVDTTSPISTDADGFTWAIISDTDSQNAYVLALNAQGLADRKTTTFYAIHEDNPGVPGDIVAGTDPVDNRIVPKFALTVGTRLLMNYVGGSWVAYGSSLISEGDLIAAIEHGTETIQTLDPISEEYVETTVPTLYKHVFEYQSGVWVRIIDGKSFLALAGWRKDLDAFLGTGLNKFGAESGINTKVKAQTNGIVTTAFEYNNKSLIGGKYYSSGFGLKTTGGGDGSEATPYNSEFWVNATNLKFTNDQETGSTSPFTIDTNGATPEVTFNGKVSINNIEDRATSTAGVGVPTSNEPEGSVYRRTDVTPNVLYTRNNNSWMTLSGERGSAILTHSTITTRSVASYPEGAIRVAWATASVGTPYVTALTGDQLVLTNTHNTNGWTNIYTFNGSNWIDNTALIVHGDMVVDGTIGADKIRVNEIFAEDVTATGTITGATINGSTITGASIEATGSAGAIDVDGVSFGTAVYGRNQQMGVAGLGQRMGVYGYSNSGYSSVGVYGRTTYGTGMVGSSSLGTGVRGHSGSGKAVHGNSNSGTGVHGYSVNSTGVHGKSFNSIGVKAEGKYPLVITPSSNLPANAPVGTIAIVPDGFNRPVAMVLLGNQWVRFASMT